MLSMIEQLQDAGNRISEKKSEVFHKKQTGCDTKLLNTE